MNEVTTKKEVSKVKQTTRQSTPKAAFPEKNELPRVGLEPTTLYTLHVHTIYIRVGGRLDDWRAE